MRNKTVNVPQEEIEKQYAWMQCVQQENAHFFRVHGRQPMARVRNFGCQMNEHDSEKLAGMLSRMGYILTDGDESVDLIIFNTCCVRENAEEKVYGHLGALKAQKRANPDMVIAVCGCMTEQPHVIEEISRKYRNVDLVFGTHNLHRFPELLAKCINEHTHVYEMSHTEGEVAEGMPILRFDRTKAWVTVMYGCNNFCSYCIVPYVRGRERSRDSSAIVEEVQALRRQGIQEITLLGQNVNSYGKDKEDELSFARLLDLICCTADIPRIRFMTSHPKDLSDGLIEVMAKYKNICNQLHLPVQSGSTDILRRMNRKYSAEQYLALIEKIRDKIPDVVLSTDIIVGFPGETEQNFADTLALMEQVRYDMAFTFIYSKRRGTPAAEYEDQVPEDVVKERFDRLIELQNRISREINETYVGRTVEVLTEGKSRTNPEKYTGRTEGNKIVNFTCGRDVTGSFVQVRIDEAATWSLDGTAADQ